ncbi:hypothetical protein AOX59_17950 [Lentibacillus amyloliquefaciens]|uniref:Uncharacterized protein n=1 Tax=Lentibacillus amyloliquefaciens TaxID=1472767 RepID=A0A0U4F447_9BACI|nr:hypothetical protein AOX59_17950 [Lentibacillus amyloliquefaciens]
MEQEIGEMLKFTLNTLKFNTFSLKFTTNLIKFTLSNKENRSNVGKPTAYAIFNRGKNAVKAKS